MKTQRITLRIPDELHEALMKEGERKGLSMNAEVIYRLMESFSNGTSEDATDMEEIARRAVRDELARIAENMTGNDLRPVADMIREALGVYRKRD